MRWKYLKKKKNTYPWLHTVHGSFPFNISRNWNLKSIKNIWFHDMATFHKNYNSTWVNVVCVFPLLALHHIPYPPVSFPCSLCIIQRSLAGGTTIRTECTCSIPTATTTRTWRRSSPTRPQSTTAPSLTDWNPPPTMWTFTLAHGGHPTGRSSTLALLTPGYRSGDTPDGASSPLSRGEKPGEHTRTDKTFSWTWLHKCVCFKVNACVWRMNSTER